MSSTARGRIVDETGTPVGGLVIETRHGSSIYPFTLASATAAADGTFTLSYAAPHPSETAGRTLQFRIVDEVKRIILEFETTDIAASQLELGDRTVTRANAEGFAVTLGNQAPAFESEGNKVSLLIDGVEAFGRVAQLFDEAQKSIFITQLFLAVPEDFNADAAKETPALVFDFGPPQVRPERQLIAKAAAVDIRIILNQPELHPIAAALLFFSIVGIYALWKLEGLTDVHDVKAYFETSPDSEVIATGFGQRLPDGVMHGKLVVVDGAKAVNLGSPMSQSYFDDKHVVENPERGGSSGYPQHDVSIGLEGPAVAALHEVFRLHWNQEAESSSDQVDSIPEPPPAIGGSDEIAALQVVRTLSDRRFDDPERGEKGILEAHLRAIRNAEELIYFENQYFTSDAIADALAEVLADTVGRPKLQVIMLLNIRPDVPGYPWMQRRHITRLRGLLPDTASGRKRLGVFTRWTHETTTPRPRIVPVYVHAKVGIVDDKWATIGSANLDGLSLDYNWLLSKFVIGESRATEANVLIFNGVDGKPATGVVDRLRQRLFAEHLDLPEADVATPPTGGWLEQWQARADAKLSSLRQDPTQPSPGNVLPYPDDDSTYTRPYEQMKALGVDLSRIDALKSVASFSLKDGSQTGKPKVDVPPVPKPVPPLRV